MLSKFSPFAIFCAAVAVAASAAAESSDDLAFFEKRIRPILIERCYECHSEEADKRKGGLWLDRRSGWGDGGDSGAALVPGKPDESLLVEMIRYVDPDIAMPPKEKLPPEEIAWLEEWIKRGAPDPREAPAVAVAESPIDIEAGREFWSFQPILSPEPPAAADAGITDIDRFLQAKLDEAGLKPSAEAEPDALLRRLTITLTGLPPAIAEQDRFLRGEETFEQAVDRLLASHAFAERWGRHWLDIARYADTSGGGRAMPLPEAWRFRDYVIESFDQDKPLDQFIREQIAGDLLPHETREQRIEQLAASGFLVLGPHNYENQDKDMLDLEIADEQMDTIGRAFMGMTIGCARCHDHKFDPIPTADYYALAGIFLSTNSVTHSNVSQWRLEPVPPTAEETAAMAAYNEGETAIKAKLDAVKKDLRGLGKMDVADKGNAVAKAELAGIVADDVDAEKVGEWMNSVSQQRWVDLSYIHDKHENKGEKSVTFRPKVEKAGRYEVRISYSSGTNRATNVPISIRHAGGQASVTLDQKKRPEHDNLTSTVGTYAFDAAEAEIRISNEGTDGTVIVDAVQLLPAGAPGLVTEKKDEPEPDQQLLADLEKQQKDLEAELKTFQKTKPAQPMIMAAGEAAKIADTRIRLRGIARNFGPETPRGFLQVALPAGSPAPVIGETQSGRLELANWIVSPENPLTARVMANRIWQHLFGEGLVSTPDNFGTTGLPPSHPELLDHLATRLTQSGWSTKTLVREIVLTDAWRRSSLGESSDADPENRLLARFPRRRIDAETLRDSILTIADDLDSAHGGPSLPPDFKSEFGYPFLSKKRTVYIPVFRNQPHEIQAAFDFANPNFIVGKRSQGTIPTQALYLMNSPEVHAQADLAAQQLLSETQDAAVETRINLAWRKTLARQPDETELALAREFLVQTGGESPESWAGLMRGLFASVDFQWVR